MVCINEVGLNDWEEISVLSIFYYIKLGSIYTHLFQNMIFMLQKVCLYMGFI
jgi:hypothetical protein